MHIPNYETQNMNPDLDKPGHLSKTHLGIFLCSQVQGLLLTSLTSTISVFNVFFKTYQLYKTVINLSYKFNWRCNALLLFWKTRHTMVIFPFLGMVTHMQAHTERNVRTKFHVCRTTLEGQTKCFNFGRSPYYIAIKSTCNIPIFLKWDEKLLNTALL